MNVQAFQNYYHDYHICINKKKTEFFWNVKLYMNYSK